VDPPDVHGVPCGVPGRVVVGEGAGVGTQGLALQEFDAEGGERGREGGHGPNAVDVHLGRGGRWERGGVGGMRGKEGGGRRQAQGREGKRVKVLKHEQAIIVYFIPVPTCASMSTSFSTASG